MQNQVVKDAILNAALSDVPFEGWTDRVLADGCLAGGYESDMILAVFPDGVVSAISHYADMSDRAMLDALAQKTQNDIRMRDKIAQACMARFHAMNAYKEQERLAIQYLMRPRRSMHAKKILWRTADCIWMYAGDTSDDYNYYTKRILLSGVLATTTPVWLNDDTHDLSVTSGFLNRRIDNVLKLGKPIGAVMKRFVR